jgi:rare lipoprotein A
MRNANGSGGTKAARRRSITETVNVTLRRPVASPRVTFPEETALNHLRISRRRTLRDALVAGAIAAAAAGGVPHSAHAHGTAVSKHAAATAKKEIAASRSDRGERRTMRARLFALHQRPHATASRAIGRETDDGTSGIASVYSDSRTASGEAMISGAMTAAHRSLPFGTRVTVVNRRNGRSVVVRINDRGPFVRGRVIDLSPAAARALGIDSLASVSLSVVHRAEKHADAATGQPTQAVAAEDAQPAPADRADADHVDASPTSTEHHADAR